jgi:hypothetical protein
MLQFKKTASANLYLEKNEEYDPNYLQKMNQHQENISSF